MSYLDSYWIKKEALIFNGFAFPSGEMLSIKFDGWFTFVDIEPTSFKKFTSDFGFRHATNITPNGSLLLPNGSKLFYGAGSFEADGFVVKLDKKGSVEWFLFFDNAEEIVDAYLFGNEVIFERADSEILWKIADISAPLSLKNLTALPKVDAPHAQR